MPFPSPDLLTGWVPDEQLAGHFSDQQMTPEQVAQWQMQFWLPKIATGGYIPPEYDNPQAMAALGQTDAYAQRMQYLNQQGVQRVATLQDNMADRARGGPAALGYAAIGAAAGTAGALAGGGAAAGGGATTYPLAGGGPITGSAIPGVTSGTTAAGATAAGIAPAAAGGAASNLPDWVGNYLMPGLNAGLGVYGANQASNAMSDASDAAIAESRRQYDTTRSDLQPWMTAGQGALNRLQDPNAFTASPGYQWARSEGMRDIGNSFAARGGAASGNALKALSEWQTGLAQQDYGNWWNQQAGLAGVGQTATNSVANVGQNTAGNVGNALMNQGASRASGVLGRTNAVQNGLYDGYQNFLYRRRAA